jgi:hypothetical protein
MENDKEFEEVEVYNHQCTLNSETKDNCYFCAKWDGERCKLPKSEETCPMIYDD